MFAGSNTDELHTCCRSLKNYHNFLKEIENLRYIRNILGFCQRSYSICPRMVIAIAPHTSNTPQNDCLSP